MNNEQLLNERWKEIDEKLSEYLDKYKKLNRKTQDKLQDIFNSVDFAYQDINKTIPKSKKNRLDRYIQDLQDQGLLTDYFGYEARLILNKKNVTYAEMLSIMIEGIYIEENKTLLEYTDNLLYSVCEISYNQGLEDIKKAQPKIKELVPFKLPIWYTLMNIPILDATYRTYLLSLAVSNADELYKKTLANIQLQKKLDVDNAFYKDLLRKQSNRIISDNLKSGAIVNVAETMVNESYLEAGLQNNVKKCRFIAEIDDKTTKMCSSLDGQIFSLDKVNNYRRYSDMDKRIVNYSTKGLSLGDNLPPIDNHFHWCRSTITYNIDLTYQKMYNITNQDAFVERIKPKDFDKKLAEYEKSIVNEEIENMYVIQPNGNVYHFVGTEGNVNAKDIDLTDAIVTHNHPKSQTRFSLSSLDMNMFNEEKISRLRGIDYKYIYEFNRNKNFKMSMPTMEELEQIENKDEAFHLDNIKSSYQYDFGYKRWTHD
ncbi:MAG TPA: hypothetical protein IAB27_05245 [Candidatus Coprosoma intestinipullorum]|uniref:Uncharacterized protein n=1 Tax=Candidatus Coprosoma intestinipullorum TaxID=2840752 RepID=A0A9D1CYV6_9FIRM|nr:hypothetical protein [Candidatus Coprosoma intestinipullorum]